MTIEWHLNRGDGDLKSMPVVASLPGDIPFSDGDVDMGDIDGDGDLDVLTHHTRRELFFFHKSAAIAWYENRITGDSNNDGVFNHLDIIQVLQAGKLRRRHSPKRHL